FTVQSLLLLLVVALQSINQPLHSRLFLTGDVLLVGTQARNHDIGIAHGTQAVTQFLHAAIDFLKRFRISARLASIKGATQAARGYAHLMHGFDIFLLADFTGPFQEFFRVLWQDISSKLRE